MVKLASMIQRDQLLNAEDEHVEYMNLRPLIQSNGKRKARKKSKLSQYLNILDPIINNITLLSFIFGSFFVPSFERRFCESVEQGEMIGAMTFLVDRVLFFVTGIISLSRSGALWCDDWVLLLNGFLYISGNVLFVWRGVYILFLQKLI